MELFDFAWFTDFYERIKDLDTLVMKEDWDYKKKPTGKNPILVNYIKHTFKKLFDEGKVTSQNGYAVFNTGLVTDKQEEVYAFFQQIQLLLPLCLTSKTDADLALVVERGNNVYRASTCLTLDMAINNARLIAKPDDEWLKI